MGWEMIIWMMNMGMLELLKDEILGRNKFVTQLIPVFEFNIKISIQDETRAMGGGSSCSLMRYCANLF